jgi:hypothetical protein
MFGNVKHFLTSGKVDIASGGIWMDQNDWNDQSYRFQWGQYSHAFENLMAVWAMGSRGWKCSCRKIKSWQFSVHQLVLAKIGQCKLHGPNFTCKLQGKICFKSCEKTHSKRAHRAVFCRLLPRTSGRLVNRTPSDVTRMADTFADISWSESRCLHTLQCFSHP